MIHAVTRTARTASWLRLATLAGLGASLAAAGQARAAIEHDSDNDGGRFRAAEVEFNTTVGAGENRYLLAAVVTVGAPAVLSVSHAGIALGFIGGIASPGGNCQVQWWGLVAPATGTLPFRVQLSADSEYLGVQVISYRGVASAGAVGSIRAAQGAPGPTGVTVASAPGDVVLDGACGWAVNSQFLLAGDQQVSRWHWSTGSLSSAGSQKSGAGTITMTWTESSPGMMEWAASAVVLRPAGAAPSIPLDVRTAGCAVARPGRHPAPWGWLALGLTWLGAWTTRRRRRH